MKTPKLVHILWLDAATHDAWTSQDDISAEPPVISTVGHLQQDTKDAVVVALSWDKENNSFSSWITIPSGMIKSKMILSPKQKRKYVKNTK